MLKLYVCIHTRIELAIMSYGGQFIYTREGRGVPFYKTYFGGTAMFGMDFSYFSYSDAIKNIITTRKVFIDERD